MTHIALVTCAAWPHGAPDDQLLIEHLAGLGASTVFARWDDGTQDWRKFDAIVLRSTWDYHLRKPEFDAWVDALEASGANVWNNPALLRWNAHKGYLLQLEQAGVSIVPTVLLTHDRAIDLGHILHERGWRKAVIKPAVSAEAHDTWICDQASVERDRARVARMLASGDVLVQPLMQEVMRDGEYSLVFFAGHYSHAFIKRPKAGDFRTQTGADAPVACNDVIVEQAAMALRAAPQPALYARVDGVVQSNQFVLMELELIEPSLWLASDPSAAKRFASAIFAAAQLRQRIPDGISTGNNSRRMLTTNTS